MAGSNHFASLEADGGTEGSVLGEDSDMAVNNAIFVP